MSKVYLDEIPTLHKALESFCKDLELDAFGSGCENWLHYQDARRMDGFLPAGHNHGTFDVYNTLESVCESEDDESTVVFHGFRIMYEGHSNGVHTVCVYYAQWHEDDTWGLERAKTISQCEIRFKTPKALITKLKSFTKKAA